MRARSNGHGHGVDEEVVHGCSAAILRRFPAVDDILCMCIGIGVYVCRRRRCVCVNLCLAGGACAR